MTTSVMEVGTRLKGGRWHLDARLATGGFSTVFSATHRNGTRAAIKILNRELTEDDDLRKRFLREGYAANKVKHSGVVRILDDDVTEEGDVYLVMELLQGEPLDRRRERLGGKLPLSEVLHIADDLLAVLAAAHEHGIIHRDIKPANLFFTTKSEIKVLDFGFAKVKETAQGESTAVGTLLGTPGFLPPERARGEADEVDARTDIWSAGATIFTLLSGVHVHEGLTPREVLQATAHRPARSLDSVAPGLPRALVEVVDRALAFDKVDRWPSATAMREALRETLLLEDQTSLAAFPPAFDRGGADASANATPTSRAPAPAPAASVTIPRLYDDLEDTGRKGLTEVMPAAPVRPRLAQPPSTPSFAPPPPLVPRVPPAFAFPHPEPVAPHAAMPRLGLFIGATFALVGIALGIAALLHILD